MSQLSTFTSFASLQIGGRMGRDPEMRYTPSGQAVVSFSVAVDHYAGKDNSGNSQYGVSWFNCSMWGEQQATFVNDRFRKGDKVVVIGTPRERKYTNKDGVEVKTWEITAIDVVMMGQQGGDDGAPEAAPAPVAAKAPVAAAAGRGRGRPAAEDLDDIPF